MLHIIGKMLQYWKYFFEIEWTRCKSSWHPFDVFMLAFLVPGQSQNKLGKSRGDKAARAKCLLFHWLLLKFGKPTKRYMFHRMRNQEITYKPLYKNFTNYSKHLCNKNLKMNSLIQTIQILFQEYNRGTQRQNFPVGVGTSLLRYNCTFCAV